MCGSHRRRSFALIAQRTRLVRFRPVAMEIYSIPDRIEVQIDDLCILLRETTARCKEQLC